MISALKAGVLAADLFLINTVGNPQNRYIPGKPHREKTERSTVTLMFRDRINTVGLQPNARVAAIA